MRLSLSQLHGELSPSMETIAFQDGTFLDALVKCLEKLYKSGTGATEALRSSNLAKVIKDHTGIMVSLEVEYLGHDNASVSPGPLYKNNILMGDIEDEAVKQWVDDVAMVNLVKRYKEEVIGGIDLKNSRVVGIYSQIVFNMYISDTFLKPRSSGFGNYSAARTLAEVILHEIGHIYTFIVYMAYGVHRALVLSQIARIAAGIDDYNKRIHVLKHAESMGCQKIDYQSLANSKPGDQGVNYQVILMTEARREIKTELGLDIYAARASEQLADQFAVRHGAGGALATFAGDDYSLGKDSSAYNNILALQVAAAAYSVMTIIGLPAVVLFILVTEKPEKEDYDDPIDRLMLIRRELYLRLKEGKVSPERRRQTLADIEAVDKLLQGARRYPDLWGWIAKIKPSIRRYNGQVALQRTLNELGANRAFAVSAMYASMEEDKLVPIQSDTTATDKLVSVLTRISTSFRSDQGGAVALAQEALSRLMQREGEARQQIPAVGQKLLASAEGATASQPHLILAACQKELGRLETSSSETAAILSSSQNLAAYFYNTGDYLNAVELNQLKRGSCLTDMVFSTEASIQRLGILSRISTAITEALPALIKEATAVAEVGSVACYQDEDSVIQRMSDQLRYICTEASPLATPDNPDMDDLGDAAGGPYPSRVHKLVKSARFSHDRAELGGNVVYRGLNQVKDPAALYLNIGASAKQALIEILPQIKTAVDHLSNTPASTVDAAETALFYERVAKLLSTLIEISEGSAQLLADIRDMTKAIDQAQDFTISLSQLIYPQ